MGLSRLFINKRKFRRAEYWGLPSLHLTITLEQDGGELTALHMQMILLFGHFPGWKLN